METLRATRNSMCGTITKVNSPTTNPNMCKENGPLAHLVWTLVFDDQHDQLGLMDLQVFVL